MKFEYEDGKVYRPASIDRIGPVIVVTCCDQEFVATIQVCYNQVDVATCDVISVRNCDNNSPEINEDNSPHKGTRIVLAPDAAAAARLATRATTPVHTAPLGIVPGVYDAIAADVVECSVLVLDLAILVDQLGQCLTDFLQ